MKKILGVLIVIGLILFAVFYKNPQKEAGSNQPVSEEKRLGLPDGWTKVDDSKVAYSLEKKVDKGLKPEIVLIKSESKDTSNPAKYVDRLVAGAKSTIPSLRVSSDKRSTESEVYSAVIAGYYYNQKNKIDLAQRIYVKGETVYTLTASFSGDMVAEVNQIMDTVAKEKVAF